MQHSFEEVQQLAHSLPEDQRIQLANSLYESVITEGLGGSEAEIEAAWGDEIKRRIDEIDSGQVKMVSHEEFLARLDAHIASKRQE